MLASRYDAVMAHVDYPAWAEYLEEIWDRHQHTPQRVLETASGTCRLAPFLHQEGRRIVTSDLNLPMLQHSQSRLFPRINCDYRALPFADHSFDSVVCLYDAVNYCLTKDDLLAFFQEANRVLEPGGMLVFDCTTSTNSRKHFQGVTQHEVHHGMDVIRHSWWDFVQKHQHNDFVFFQQVSKDHWTRTTENHVQKVWSLAEFQRVAKQAGLLFLEAIDEEQALATARSERIHLILRAGW
jgi:ubiquinone/menaquinone biosynthesis C-methylase UbiE